VSWRPRRGEDKGPRTVRDSLDTFARRLGAPEAGALSVVFAHWGDIVGESVAAHTRPVSLVQGVLRVAVDQPGWATQLKYLAPRLVERLGEVAGAGVVTSLEVRVEAAGGR
jgi:predicted nucleic acid-binding Zn ribbon protein